MPADTPVNMLAQGQHILSLQPFSAMLNASLEAFSPGRAELSVPVAPALPHWQLEGRPHPTRALMIALPCAVGTVVSLLIVLLLAGSLFPVDIPVAYKASYELPKP